MTLFVVGFILGILVGAFIASKPFRDKVIKSIKDYQKKTVRKEREQNEQTSKNLDPEKAEL